MIGRLNHVGVAVPSIEDAKATYRDLYGVPESAITETRELAAQGVKFAFVNVANSQIELIEPLGESSPIRNFLEKNPKGGQKIPQTTTSSGSLSRKTSVPSSS